MPTISERFKKIKLKYVLGGLVLLLLILGVGVGLFLSSQSQDVRQQASGPGTYPTCAGGVQAGQRACDTFRSYVTCGYEGQFGDSTPCPGNSTCSGGVCADRTWCDRSTNSACADVAAGTSCGSGRTCVITNAGGANTDCLCQASDTGTTPSTPPTEPPSVAPNPSQSPGVPPSTPPTEPPSVEPNPSQSPGVPPSTPPTVPPSVAPNPSPSPGVPPSPIVTPTPGVTPSPQVSPSPSPTPLPAVCGGACSFTSQCPQDHTCNNNRCQLTACVNGASCSDDVCRVTACGSSCSTNTDCPNVHTCNNNRCVLNACINGSVCTNDLCRITGCGNSCSNNGECPSNHTCNNNRCQLTACVNGANCDSNRCYVVNNPTPVPTAAPVGCNDPCVNNSDCKASNHICVDTVNGRRCRYEGNITSDICAGAPVVVAQGQGQPTPVATPAVLPTAGSNDIVMAISAGAAAIILGIVGFLML